MKILHTNFHKGWGGQSNRILIVCRELAQRGHEVAIAAPPGSELVRRAQAQGVRTFEEMRFPRGLHPLSLLCDIRAMRTLLLQEKFDIVHTHGSQDAWCAAFALLGMSPRPHLLRTKHNIFPIREHFANRWLYGRMTEKIICISRAVLEYCAAKPYLRRENLVLIHSAVNAELYARGDREKIRKELGLGGHYVAGIVGRLRPEKGHHTLLEAFARLKDRAPDMMLVVCGDGSIFQELSDFAKANAISARMIFTGFRTDIPDILSALDVFILPSLSEGLGTAVLEAGAAGLPIIASNVGGIPDIIEDGASGILVPPTDVSALAEAIKSVYSNPEKAKLLGMAAQRRVRQHFSEKALVDKNESLYQSLINAPE